MKKHLINLMIAVMPAVLFISCSGGKKEVSNEEKKQEIEEFVEKEFTYPIPTSFEVTQMLNNAKTAFNSEIVNDPKKADQYVTTWQKATNLGVYGADLSYAATFDKTQETIDFLDVSKKLIDDLNISTAFNENMAERIEGSMENIDSLIYIISESFYD
ncbi:MAG: hypothetical protein AAGA66_13815, partial [Bacteroidota bacterium]